MKIKVSNNVIRRLPKYLRLLSELEDKKIARVSSAELANYLGFTSSQIRQDFSCFGEFGQQGYGYNVSNLKNEIKRILGSDRGYKAILVGCGSIGKSLINNFCFEEHGIRLCAGFDINPQLIGTTINGMPILSADSMPGYLINNHIDIAVLTVPKDKALESTKQLTDCGIEAFWNFTNIDIVSPYSDILVENVHFSDSLLALSYYVSENRK